MHFVVKVKELRKLLSEPLVFLLVVCVFMLIVFLVLYPLISVFQACFFIEKEGQPHFTLQYFTELLTKPYNRTPLYNSLLLGVLVAVLGTLVGFIFAFSLSRTPLPLKPFFKTMATLPIISPPFVIALSAILLFGRNGFATKRIFLDTFHIDLYAHGFDIYGLLGLVVVEVLSYFPTAYLVLTGTLESMDPSLEEAAVDLGASKFLVFRKITLPLALPGILSSLLLLFMESLADFGTPLVLSGRFQVLTTQSYLQITGNDNQPGGASLALLLLFPSIFAFLLQNMYLEKKSFVTVTGKAQSPRTLYSGKTLTAVLTFICAFLSGIVILFYGLVALGSFTRQWSLDHRLTLENYRDAFTVGWDYMKDSLVISFYATILSALFGTAVAYLVERKRFPGRKLLELSSMLTFAVPGTVVGIGYILAFNKPPLQFTGTGLIIVLLLVFRNAPVAIRAGIAQLKQVSSQIEEAAASLGAGSFTTFFRVTLPLMAPAFFSGLVFSFVRSMTSISAVIFVVSGNWNLITVAVLGFVENSDLSQAAALSMILVFFVLTSIFVIQKILLMCFRARLVELEPVVV